MHRLLLRPVMHFLQLLQRRRQSFVGFHGRVVELAHFLEISMGTNLVIAQGQVTGLGVYDVASRLAHLLVVPRERGCEPVARADGFLRTEVTDVLFAIHKPGQDDQKVGRVQRQFGTLFRRPSHGRLHQLDNPRLRCLIQRFARKAVVGVGAVLSWHAPIMAEGAL